MARQRRCKTAGCSNRFTPAPGTNRLHCESCRPPRGKPAPAAVVDLPVEPELGPIEAATRAELVAAGVEATSAGAAALNLARRLDVGMHTGSQAAALVRELRASVEGAMRQAKPVGSSLDELRARRLKRASG